VVTSAEGKTFTYKNAVDNVINRIKNKKGNT